MIAHKKKFSLGLGMLIAFGVALTIIFSPVFNGQNGLNFLDDTYNSISKGSAYYVPEVQEKAAPFSNTIVDVNLSMLSDSEANHAALLFEKAGAEVQVTGSKLTVNGKLGNILKNCLEDADLMYHNDGKTVSRKYGLNERLVLYSWHTAFKAIEKDLNRQKKFKEAHIIALVVKKAIDLSYNYYTIEPKEIGDSLGVVIFSLIFYVIYTLWFGFSILFMFEGWGLKLEH